MSKQRLPAHMPMPILIAAILTLTVLVAPAHGEYTYSCTGITPQQINGFWNYMYCHIDFDPQRQGFERTAKFYENRGSASNPPHETAGDRHCYQAFDFQSGDDPLAEDFGYIRFSLLKPEGYTSGSFPLLVVLRGGLVGWSDVADGTKNSWRLNNDDESAEEWFWETARYKGTYGLSDGSKDDDVMLEFLTDDDGNVVDELRKTFPDWAIMVPSGCSHDMWNGRSDLDPQQFKNAAQTRYSYEALVEALDWVNDEHGIDYLYVVGGSGGGGGGLILAHDLPVDLPTGVEFRGVVSEAGPLEADAMEVLAAYDERDVDADGNCQNGPETTVPCDHPAEPFDTAFQESGLSGRSASADIAAGTTVPILHMYNSRDPVQCYDYCYSDENLHGAIRDAINARKEGGFNEDFDASASVEMCVGACKGDNDVALTCTRHTVLGWQESDPVDDAVACAVGWIEEVNDYFEGVIQVPELPAVCDDIEEGTGSTSTAPTCDSQDEVLY